ncbi:MAG TPA: hypothetical protein VFO07_10230, partial [Roseiflexaceae bacterium]|nr:hypothetical protein [Roseiflexaceae bacterium]
MPSAGDTRAIYCPSCGASVEMTGNTGSCMYCGTTVERQQSTGDNPRFTVTQTNLGSPPASSYSTFNQPAPPRRNPALVILGIILSLACVVIGAAVALLVFLSGRPGPVSPPIVEPRVTAVAEQEIVEGAPSPAPVQVPLAGDININEMIAGLPRDGVGEDMLAYVNNSGDQGLSVVMIDGGSLA